MLSACSQEGSLTSQLREFDPYNYTVQAGDTLYSIAWRYDIDYRDIVRWNAIAPSYLIHPGQRLKMRGPITEPADKTYLFASAPVDEVATSIDYSDPDNIPPAPPVNRSTAPPAISQSSSANKAPVYRHRKSTPKTSSDKPPRTAQINTRPAAASGSTKTNWIWPVQGKVISTFSANDNDRKGIDIVGTANETIRAAGDGVVVYSGSGLISYGNLVIVKHNDRYLSAYAYNEKLLVTEGAKVKRGQGIAIIGKKAKVTNLLHFEIRKDGKPVNPLVYLPKS